MPGPVQLSDVYVPEPFQSAVDEAAIERNTFIQSGVMVSNPIIEAMASVGGNVGEMPFFGPLDATGEPDYTDDNPDHKSSPDGISSKKMLYRLATMHKSWSTMDLVRELALKDPLGAIASKVAGYWVTQMQKRLIYAALGIMADNVANDSGDMVIDIATDANSAVTAAEKISPDSVIDAAQTMGDRKESLTALAVHSVIYTQMEKEQLIDTIPTGEAKIDVPYYLGKYRIVVDDGMPITQGTYRKTYLSVLFASGVFGHGKGTVMKPSEMFRDPEAGYGSGMDVLHSRRADIIHPEGFSFLSGSVAGQSATLAELALAANWNRVVDRKLIGMAFLKTNG